MTDINGDSDGCAGKKRRRPRAAQADLFLYRADSIDCRGEFAALLRRQQADRLRYHERAHFVVDRVSDKGIAFKAREAGFIRDRIADADLCKRRLAAAETDIDKQLVQNRVLLTLLGVH